MRADGLPSGVTLIAPAFFEAKLAGFGAAFHAKAKLPLGATGHALPETAATAAPPSPSIRIAVFGAHMQGQPLNHEILGLGGRYVAEIKTAPIYKLYRIDAGGPPRPGVLRVAEGGVALAGEIWDLPTAGFGAFVAGIPAPLGIGTVTLADGTTVKGFLCEAAATVGAEDISRFADWRAYRASLAK
jgi:allophanate hydrolase